VTQNLLYWIIRTDIPLLIAVVSLVVTLWQISEQRKKEHNESIAEQRLIETELSEIKKDYSHLSRQVARLQNCFDNYTFSRFSSSDSETPP
jgi:uncharacterized protein YlxW (UPF0749 family)